MLFLSERVEGLVRLSELSLLWSEGLFDDDQSSTKELTLYDLVLFR